MRQYYLHIVFKDDKDHDKACEIAFDSGKGCCGCAFGHGSQLTLYIYGKFCDMVRVYSALKNNGYEPRIEEVYD